MKSKDSAVVIERVGNGYQVRPMGGRDDMVCVQDIMVFQDKGLASNERDHQPVQATLFGWLDQHFTKADQKD